MNTTTGARPTAARTDRRLVRAGARLIAAAGVALAMTIGLASPASADVATSWGFQCNPTYNTVRQNWPNISTRSASLSEVYMRASLYRWNGYHWDRVVTSPWYVGVSNVTGRKALGYFGGLPYYFALATHPSQVMNNTGFAFTGMRDGYYRTNEQYFARGQYWSTWSHVQGSTSRYCRI